MAARWAPSFRYSFAVVGKLTVAPWLIGSLHSVFSMPLCAGATGRVLPAPYRAMRRRCCSASRGKFVPWGSRGTTGGSMCGGGTCGGGTYGGGTCGGGTCGACGGSTCGGRPCGGSTSGGSMCGGSTSGTSDSRSGVTMASSYPLLSKSAAPRLNRSTPSSLAHAVAGTGTNLAASRRATALFRKQRTSLSSSAIVVSRLTSLTSYVRLTSSGLPAASDSSNWYEAIRSGHSRGIAAAVPMCTGSESKGDRTTAFSMRMWPNGSGWCLIRGTGRSYRRVSGGRLALSSITAAAGTGAAFALKFR
eukprot:1330295-Prymnesium_polylepis.1